MTDILSRFTAALAERYGCHCQCNHWLPAADNRQHSAVNVGWRINSQDCRHRGREIDGPGRLVVAPRSYVLPGEDEWNV